MNNLRLDLEPNGDERKQIADGLSLVCTVLCLIMKVPQLRTVIMTKKSDGISIPSLLLEYWAWFTTTSYNVYFQYPPSLYSEYFPLLVQDFILILMVSNKKKHILVLVMTTVIHGIICYIGMNSFIPSSVPTFLLTISSPFGLLSKMIQLWAIVSTKKAGSVSSASWAMNAISSTARCGSIYLTVQDWALMSTLIPSSLLNLAVAIAAFIYRDEMVTQSPPKEDDQTKKEKMNEAKKDK